MIKTGTLLGEKLKQARLNKGLTQLALSQLTGIKNTVLSNWENNVNKPDVDSIEALCTALDIAPNYFFDTIKNGPAANGETDERKERLIKNYESMNDEGREMLAKLADDMVASGRHNNEKLVTYRLVARNGYNNVHEIKGKDFDPDKVEGIKGDDF